MVKYGHVYTAEDIRRINAIIRRKARKAKTRDYLRRLYNQSKYLVTLTYTPGWKTRFGYKPPRRTAKQEFSKTARAINRRLEKLDMEARYDTKWGKGR